MDSCKLLMLKYNIKRIGVCFARVLPNGYVLVAQSNSLCLIGIKSCAIAVWRLLLAYFYKFCPVQILKTTAMNVCYGYTWVKYCHLWHADKSFFIHGLAALNSLSIDRQTDTLFCNSLFNTRHRSNLYPFCWISILSSSNYDYHSNLDIQSYTCH